MRRWDSGQRLVTLPRMIDTHCHLTDPRLRDRLDEVLAAAADAGVTGMISVATTPADAQAALAIAQAHPHVYATVGVHPLHAAAYDEDEEFYARIGEISPFIGHPDIVAIGEIGLDRAHDDPPLDVQRRTFARQLELAKTLTRLPIIIHNRDATDDTLAMLREAGLPGDRFVFHCFTGAWRRWTASSTSGPPSASRASSPSPMHEKWPRHRTACPRIGC